LIDRIKKILKTSLTYKNDRSYDQQKEEKKDYEPFADVLEREILKHKENISKGQS
jgi:hypothetical protein